MLIAVLRVTVRAGEALTERWIVRPDGQELLQVESRRRPFRFIFTRPGLGFVPGLDFPGGGGEIGRVTGSKPLPEC